MTKFRGVTEDMRQATPIFQTTMQALHVSFMMASLPATQKGNTQSVIEWMREISGKPEQRNPDEISGINFSGLTREQVRGQCAMIRGHVESTCMAPEIHAIRIKFCEDETKADAVRYFGDYLPNDGLDNRPLKLYMLWWLYMNDLRRKEYGISLRSMQGEFGVDHVTIGRHASRMGKVIEQLARVGASRVESHFIAQGIVKQPDPVDSRETVTP